MGVQIRAGQLAKGGMVRESSGGEKLALVQQGGVTLYLYSALDSTPVQEDYDPSTTIFPGSSNIFHFDGAIDSADSIHMACAGGSLGHTRYAIATESAGSWTFGSWETIFQYTETSPSTPGIAIDVDTNDKPHVVAVDNIKTHGTAYTQIVYAEKTGASWSSPVLVCGNAQSNYGWPALTLKASNNGEAVYYNSNDHDLYYNTLTSGSWGTESSYTATLAVVGNPSVTVDSSATVRRYHSDTATDPIYENNSDTGYDTNNGNNQVAAALDPGTNDRYVFYIDTGDDVHLISNSGSGWTDEGDLQVGTYDYVIAGWQYNNLNNTTTIDYLYDDGTYVYWDEYTLSGGQVINLTAVGALATSTSAPIMAVSRPLTAAGLLATTTPAPVLAVERPLQAAGQLSSVTSAPILTIESVILLVAAGILASSTTTPVLAIDRALSAAGALGTTSSAPILAVERPLSAAGQLSSSTTAPILAVERLLVAAGILASSASAPQLELAVFLVAAGLMATSTSTPQLAVERPLQAIGQLSSTTTTPVLAVVRVLQAAGLLASVTSTPILSLAADILLSAAGQLSSSTSSPQLAIERLLSGAGQLASVTSAPVLTVEAVILLSAAGLLASSTSTPQLSVERALASSAQLATSTSSPQLAIERALSAIGQLSSSTSSARLNVVRLLVAAALIQSVVSSARLDVEQAEGLLVAIFTGKRGGGSFTGKRGGGSPTGGRPDSDFTGAGPSGSHTGKRAGAT